MFAALVASTRMRDVYGTRASQDKRVNLGKPCTLSRCIMHLVLVRLILP